MLVTVIVPAFNEARTIEQVLRRLAELELDCEILVVDDGSSDQTAEIVGGLEPEITGLRLIVHERNQGKGAAVRTGINASAGDFVMIQDADLEYDPAEFTKLLQPILDNKADVVFGSRFIGSDAHRVLYFWHSVANRILTTASNMFTNLNLTDMETCYKCFKREVIQSIDLQEKRFGIEPELASKVAKGRWRIYEVGISYSGRTYEEGKKIGPKDAFRAIYCILKYR